MNDVHQRSAHPPRVSFLWSNPDAPTQTVIRAALVRPTFDRLLTLARDHGAGGLEREWDALRAEGSDEAKRAAVSVERILHHIKIGFTGHTLPHATQRLWERLQAEPLLAGFVLVGGAVLVLRVGHRISQGLDFMFVGTRLPSPRLEQLRQVLGNEGVQLERSDDPKTSDEFEIADVSQRENYQAFVAEGVVKLSLFVPGQDALAFLQPGLPDAPRVAELEEIFALKSLLTTSRSRTRDWFDLWTLMTKRGFTIADLRAAFGQAEAQREIAMRRLHSGTVPLHDPGYDALATTGPSPEQLRAFFRAAVEAEESRIAQAAVEEDIREGL